MRKQIIKLPGLVDVHVHLREPGGIHKENFATGSQAAIAGGYTQILDMPNNIPPTIDEKSLNDKIKKSKGRIWCDLGFNFGATDTSTKHFNKIYKKSFGLKVYMNQTTGPLLISEYKNRDFIFKSWHGKLPIMVHAEGETIEVAIKLAKKYKKRLHICHTTSDQIKAIEKAKKDGVKISCEVCPHHLFLNKDDEKKLGPLAKMKPPLLSKNEQESLWKNLDKIDMISTDHAPHALVEKKSHPTPFGVPGLETTVPLLFSALSEKLLSYDRLVEMLSTNPRRIFKLPAQSNTYVLVDISEKNKILDKKLFTKCRWSPFKNFFGRGEVRKVVLRGKPVFENGKFIGKPEGRVIKPNY